MDSSYSKTASAAVQSNLSFTYTGDSSFKKDCGYLIVPENRKAKRSKTIRLPFIILRSKNPDKKKDPLLFTSGGPGNSSLSWINGMSRSTVINNRDCIAFEQRGTRFAIPYLRVFELDSALKESYRENLDKDSMWLEGVKKYKQVLVKKGIDLAGYNSGETADDMHDLLKALAIDSVNLSGGSYSGGLMMAVLQKDPARIRSLILDSPLPMFSPIDEDEPVHFIEALKILSDHAQKDSADKDRYSNLFEKFDRYFRSIQEKKFRLNYPDVQTGKVLNIEYDKRDLLDIIVSNMLNSNGLKEMPFLVTEIINGNHEKYVRQRIDKILQRYPAPDGMRMLVYCADQAAYHDPAIVKQVYQLYPYLEGYRINDVWKTVCDCWNNLPVNPVMKKPFYSAVPVLAADGEMDPACSPRYLKEIKHYMPNGQYFLFLNRGHGVGGKEWYDMTQQFLDNPFQKIGSPSPAIIAY